MNATASLLRAVAWKVFRLVTSRRKLASTIGVRGKAAPVPEARTLGLQF